MSGELECVLEILCDSVNMHLADGDFERLRWRINWTLSELERLCRMMMVEAGLPVVARFIKNAATIWLLLRD